MRGASATSRLLPWALGLLLLVRLATLGLYPLTDTTEARYADIARRMVQAHDWVTPWFDDGVPFWGKPPLSFWATALGMRWLGAGEFAVRLPHLLMALLVLAVVWRHAGRTSRRQAWHAAALLAGSVLFVVASGAVMTDMALTLGTTLVMAGFWRRVDSGAGAKPATVGAWAMVTGASIALLAKGPVALVLCGLAILVWAAASGRVLATWRKVPWLRGAALVLALSLPWYLVAEQATPGFLHYFFVGEHWQRFVEPGWAGDRYGSAHAFPRGSIWAFALAAAMPWTALAPLAWWAWRRSDDALAPGASRLQARFLWAWALVPCVFFTFAGNVLWTYVLPALPAWALLAADWTARRAAPRSVDRALAACLLVTALAGSGMLLAGLRGEHFERKSTRALVADYEAHRAPGQALYFVGRRPFSGSYYTQGQARVLSDPSDLPQVPAAAFLAMTQPSYDALAPAVRARLALVSRRDGRVLLQAAPD